MPSSAPAKTVRGSAGWTLSAKTRLSLHSPAWTRCQLSPPSGLTQAPLPIVPTQIVMFRVIASPPRPFPAGVGDVDDDAVGAGPFHLEIARASHRHVGLVPAGELRCLGAFEPGDGLVEILDLEADMMDAAEIGAVGADIGVLFGLPIEDREIDVTVAEEHGAVRASAQLAHAEGLLVKGGDFCRLLCGQRDMLDSRHFPLPFCASCGP